MSTLCIIKTTGSRAYHAGKVNQAGTDDGEDPLRIVAASCYGSPT